MKKLVSFLSAAALVAALMTAQSCAKTCDAGYEGSDCKTEMRAKFLNANGWSADETGSRSGHTVPPFTVNINTTADGVAKVHITNMWNSFAHDVVATVNGSTFSIANQSPDADQFSISGSGTLTGSTIAVTYSVSDTSGHTDAVTGTWTKK